MFTPEEVIVFAEFIKEHTREVESYGEDEITMNMNDCNEEMWNWDGTEMVSWLDYLKEALHGKVEFVSGGDGHWTTIRLLEEGKTYYRVKHSFDWNGKRIERIGGHQNKYDAERDYNYYMTSSNYENSKAEIIEVVFGK